MALCACSRQPENHRLAILPFENLSGDASLNWMETAGPSIVAAETSGIRVASASEAYLNDAGRLVHGYFTSRGFEIAVEDTSRHKLSDARPYSGSLLGAMTAAAKAIDPAARAFSTSHEDAVEAWGRRDFEKAVALDTDFGAAWLAWAEAGVAHGDSAQAMSIADRALARNSLCCDMDRARIALFSATLRKDEAGRAAALAKLSKLTNDPASTLALADAELNARHFEAAIAAFKSALAPNPGNAAVLLSLGYAQAYAGDLEAAKSTFETYGKAPGKKANSLDSLGEAFFMNGRFTDAEKYFLAAYQSNPGFVNGADSWKAAYAHWLAGDLKGADAIAARSSPEPWRQASWLFSTGRRDQAIAKLQSVPDKTLVQRQLAAWNAPLPDDVAGLKSRYMQTPPAQDDEIRTVYAMALIKAGQKDEARKLLARWPLPVQTNSNSLTDSRIFPAFLEAKRALE